MAMGVGFAVIWSSAFTSAKIQVTDVPPLYVSALRFALAGVLSCGLAWALGQSARLTRRQWWLAGVFGLCQNTLYLGLNFYAMTRIEGGLAAVIASVLPLLVAALGWAFLGERPRPLGALGLALGFAGVIWIMGGRLQGGSDPAAIAMCVGGALALAVATLALRGIAPGRGLLMIVGLQMFVGAATLAPLSWWLEAGMEARWTRPALIAFLYTTLVPGVIATVIWFRLVRRIGAVKAAAFHFLNPALGVAIAWVLLAEPLGWQDAAGVAVATLGILLVQLAQDRAAAAPGGEGAVSRTGSGRPPPPPRSGGSRARSKAGRRNRS
ncbi:MAG: EamA family transporter [Pseudomonadota bacterium]